MHENEAWVLYQKPNETRQYLLKSGKGNAQFCMTSFLGYQTVSISGTVEIFQDQLAEPTEWKSVPFPASTQQESHLQKVKEIVELIRSGEIHKIVLSKVAQIEHESSHLVQLFKALCKAYPKAFNYVCYHPESGIWSGATPEILLQRKHKQFTTVALAGTRIEDGKSTWSEKEYQEQVIVKDYILKELIKAKVESIHVSELSEAQNGHLRHLKNTLTFTHHGPEKSLLQALHPTPAVCGTPKQVAQDIIERLEAHDRHYYTGYLSLISNQDEADYYVNLRCMQVSKNVSLLYAGGGITESSDPIKEWNELLTKTKILKDVILSLQNNTHVQR